MVRKVKKPQFCAKNILVVDDDRQICEILSDHLLSVGHVVERAADGVEALEKLDRKEFNIVITDIDMPRMDGMEFIRRLGGNNDGIDVIAITGHITRYSYTDVVEAGASDFLTKPFTLNELEAKINRVIRERRLLEKLERLAIRDPLTGLLNRRQFIDILRKEAIRAIRYDHPLFIFFMDIDFFKSYNDMFGHQAGDDLLRKFAVVLQSSIREDVDSTFRYGGDEFLVLLPHLPCHQAISVAERIRENYGLLGLKPTSLSIGVAKLIHRSGSIDSEVGEMIQRSDKALYEAKNSPGRNLVRVDPESL